jgi:hypothetical protein
MKIISKKTGAIEKLRLSLSYGPCLLLMGAGCLMGSGEMTFAQSLRVSQQPAASSAKVLAAKAAQDEGMRLYQQGTAELLRQAAVKFQEAASLYAAVGEQVNQATCLNNIGGVYDALGEKQKALVQLG